MCPHFPDIIICLILPPFFQPQQVVLIYIYFLYDNIMVNTKCGDLMYNA